MSYSDISKIFLMKKCLKNKTHIAKNQLQQLFKKYASSRFLGKKSFKHCMVQTHDMATYGDLEQVTLILTYYSLNMG